MINFTLLTPSTHILHSQAEVHDVQADDERRALAVRELQDEVAALRARALQYEADGRASERAAREADRCMCRVVIISVHMVLSRSGCRTSYLASMLAVLILSP